jgi:hypothetical protein
MASQDAFFRIRPSKRSNPEARTTLDSLHTVQIQTIFDKEGDVASLKSEIAEINTKCRELANEIEYEQLQKRLRDLEKELDRRTNNTEFYEYFLNTGEILYNYYEIQEKIHSGAEPAVKRANAKAKPGSVLAALESAAAIEQPIRVTNTASVPQGEILRRDKLL